MINYIKDAVSAVSGIKTFLFNTDYRNNFDLQNVEFPCCVLTPIMRTNYDLNNIIRESAELQLSVVESAPYDYTGDDLYAINKRCSDLALQVIANLQVKSKLDKELTFEFILPSGDELISGVMCNLTATMRQGSCNGAPSYVEIVVQPIKKESITSNGKHVITPSSGFTAMKEVEVDVQIPQARLDLIGWDGDDMNMFVSSFDTNIAYSKTLLDAWDSNNTSARNLYKSDKKLVYASKIDTSNVTDMNGMFYYCDALTLIPQLNTSKVTNMGYMFEGCKVLKTIPLLDTSKVTSMTSMFKSCSALTSIPQLNTSNVESMFNMFKSCSALTSIPQLNTSKVTDMGQMFGDCNALTSIPLLDTSKVTSMTNMFYHCYALITIPQLDTSKVEDMRYMFQGCKILTTIPQLDTSNATRTDKMFDGCLALTNLGGFKNLKVALDLSPCKLLTHQSLMNVINNLYDLTANGLSGQTLTLGSTNLAKLTADEIAIGTNKGWTIK